MTTIEFDEYAADYDSGMENPVKQLLGRDARQYIRVKVRWLEGYLTSSGMLSPTNGPLRVLDMGCGTGLFLQELLENSRLDVDVAGCDVSQGMLDEAERTTPQLSGRLRQLVDSSRFPYSSGEFDVVLVSAVLHHVARDQWDRLLAETRRVVAPGGCVAVFEHNPYNPVTRWVVAHTKIDRHAVLAPPPEVERALRGAGFACSLREYLMFFPPRLQWLSRRERWLRWFPLGAQYAVIARPKVPDLHTDSGDTARCDTDGDTDNGDNTAS